MELGTDYTNKLAEYIFRSQNSEYPTSVKHDFKRALMDYLCAAITGSNMPVTRSVLDYIKTIDNDETCSVNGNDVKLSPLNAAFVNGTSAHALDFDDGHTHGSIHIGVAVFPAILSVAEQYKSSIDDVIRASIVGYDVAGRLSAALHPNVWKRGYHNTPVIGIFGAVAGVCVLLKATKEQILSALGHAGSFSGGLFEFLGEGADTKRLHPGKSTRDAILCVELAMRGITGPNKVLEGKNGFFRAFADGKVNEERLFLNLNSEFEISKIYIKPYPCCRHLHGPIDGVKELLEENSINISEIESIKVGTYNVGSKHNHREITHLLDAQMSIPCAISLAIIYGDVTIDSFSESKLHSDDVKTLIQKVEVYKDEKAEELYPSNRPATIKIKLKNGDLLEKTVLNPKGEPDYPLTDEELEEKFFRNCEGIIPNTNINKIIQAIWNIENERNVNALFLQ